MDIIWIGNDHGGYDLKMLIVKHLEEKGIPVKDAGCYSLDNVRYPYFANEVASAVSKGYAKRGILICSSGIGMSIIANKFKGVRASLCTSPTMAKLTRGHNDSNILCLGAKLTGVWEALEIVDAWISSEFESGPRHETSLGLIRDAEEVLCNDAEWQPKTMV